MRIAIYELLGIVLDWTGHWHISMGSHSDSVVAAWDDVGKEIAMTTYLWVLIVLFSLSSIGKLIMLVEGKFPLRAPGTEAWNIVIQILLIIWAVLLL